MYRPSRAQRLNWSEATNVARPARSASSIGGSLTRSNEGVRRDLIGYKRNPLGTLKIYEKCKGFENRTRFESQIGFWSTEEFTTLKRVREEREIQRLEMRSPCYSYLENLMVMLENVGTSNAKFWKGAQVLKLGFEKISQHTIKPSHFGSCPSVQR